MDEMLKAGKKYPASRPAKAQEEMDKEMTAHIGKVFGLVADEFEVFTKENPSSAFVGDALLRAANFYVSADKFGKAIPLLEKLESSHAQDARFLNQYAWALLKQNKDLKKAHALAEKADKLAPKNVPIMDTLAEIEFAMGNADRALEICNEEIKLAPGAPMLQKRLEKYTEAKNKKKK
jgi:tetratricopeptide (TPR) repeat protein